MGVNNRQRRAAKQRKRAKARAQRQSGPEPITDDGGTFGAGWQPFAARPDERALAAELLTEVIGGLQSDPDSTGRLARLVTEHGRRIDPTVIADVIHDWLSRITVDVVKGGWAPSDLFEIVRRRGHARQLPALSALLTTETDRHRDDTVSAQWREELDRLPRPEMPDLTTASGLERVFALAAVLCTLPRIERRIAPPGSAAAATSHVRSGASTKHLTRVRALLAKAESTESAEEAEALSAKAQELISRYALERLVDEPVDEHDHNVGSRRLWIDAPYVIAKASLINQIAEANRCRTVVSSDLGFSTIIGEPIDIDAVELMTASLLVQAQSAMAAHGRHVDATGTSRTRSFRKSFLMAYATRIGERLRIANEEAVEETGKSAALVPVLQRHAEHVDAAVEEMFPHLVQQRTSISNGQGLAAGRAAADLARLDAHKNVTTGA